MSKRGYEHYHNSLPARSLDDIVARDHVLHGATADIPCADLRLENLRLARHIVQRGVLASNEAAYCYHAPPETEHYNPRYPTPYVRRNDVLPHACNDCLHKGETRGIIGPQQSWNDKEQR